MVYIQRNADEVYADALDHHMKVSKRKAKRAKKVQSSDEEDSDDDEDSNDEDSDEEEKVPPPPKKKTTAKKQDEEVEMIPTSAQRMAKKAEQRVTFDVPTTKRRATDTGNLLAAPGKTEKKTEGKLLGKRPGTGAISGGKKRARIASQAIKPSEPIAPPTAPRATRSAAAKVTTATKGSAKKGTQE